MAPTTRDMALTIGLVVSFGLLVAVHVATVFGLARRHHVGQAVGGFFVPPLATYWAFKEGMRVRAIVFLACAALYVVAFILAR